MTLSQIPHKDIGRDLVLNHSCFSLERKGQTENSLQKKWIPILYMGKLFISLILVWERAPGCLTL